MFYKYLFKQSLYRNYSIDLKFTDDLAPLDTLIDDSEATEWDSFRKTTLELYDIPITFKNHPDLLKLPLVDMKQFTLESLDNAYSHSDVRVMEGDFTVPFSIMSGIEPIIKDIDVDSVNTLKMYL